MPFIVKIWYSIEFHQKIMGSRTVLSKLMVLAKPIKPILTSPLKKSYLSSSVSAWKVLSTTVVRWRPRILKVNFLGLSVRMISQFLTVKLLRILFRFASVLGSFLYPMNSPLSFSMKYLGLQSFKCSAEKKLKLFIIHSKILWKHRDWCKKLRMA